jgi:hypothetical protein
MPMACIEGTQVCVIELKWDKSNGDQIKGILINGGQVAIENISITFSLSHRGAIVVDATAVLLSAVPPSSRWTFAATPIITSPNMYASYSESATISGIIRGPTGTRLFTDRLQFSPVWNPSYPREKKTWENGR